MYIDRVIFILLITAYFAAPSLLAWFNNGEPSWYRPYLIWLALIVTNYWLIDAKLKDARTLDKDSAL